MFFSTRSSSDTAAGNYENMSMQSLVKAMKASEKKADNASAKATSPSTKKGENPATAMKVYSSPNSVDSRPAAQTSDQLVRKLFKGLGVPLFEPRVPAMFIKETVPPAIKDYRWTAYDLTVNHDTMLSIIPPPPPPTPPPLPTPTPQQIMESISIKDIEQKRIENSRSGSDRIPNEAVPDKSAVSVKSPRLSTISTKEKDRAPSAKAENNSSISMSVKSLPENAKKRKLSGGRTASDKPQQAIEDATAAEPLIIEQRHSGRTGSSRKADVLPAPEAEEKPEVTPQLSARLHEEAAAMMAAEGTTVDTSDRPINSTFSMKNSARLLAMETSLGSGRGASSARVLDYSQKAAPEVRKLSSQKASESIEDQREMLPVDSDTILEKKFSGLAVQQMSVKSPQATSSRGRNYSFNGADQRDNDAVSIEALLDLNSPESQWSFLKEVAPVNTEENVTTTEIVASSKVLKSPKAAPRSPIHSPPAFIPPVPIASPSPKGKQSMQYDIDRSPADTEYHEFQRSLQMKEHHVGKIVSPAERSVFKPTFAVPRPSAQDSIASLLVSDGAGEKHFSLHTSNEETPSITTVGNAKGKRNGYSALEDAFLTQSPPPRVQHIQALQYGKHSADDDNYNGNAYEHEQDQEAEQEHKFSRHKKVDGAAHKGKHHSPSHWYMAGAYSSHSEAMEAIGRLNKILAAQSPNPDGDEGNHFRLQRDLSRMQWVVECNDLHNKAAVLSHTSKSGSHEKDKNKYRNIIGSIHKEEQANVKHTSPTQQQDAHPHQQGEGKGRQKGQGLQGQGHGQGHGQGRGHEQVSPEAHLHGGQHGAGRSKKDDKYLRDRDAYVEQNLRAIRQQLPKEDSPTRAEGGTKFPPINQNQKKKGKGGRK